MKKILFTIIFLLFCLSDSYAFLSETKEIDPNEYKEKSEEDLSEDDLISENIVLDSILSNSCHNCGSKLRKNSNYCFECGFNIELGVRLKSQNIIPKKVKECIYCKSKIKKRDKFCSSCGTIIEL